MKSERVKKQQEEVKGKGSTTQGGNTSGPSENPYKIVVLDESNVIKGSNGGPVGFTNFNNSSNPMSMISLNKEKNVENERLFDRETP